MRTLEFLCLMPTYNDILLVFYYTLINRVMLPLTNQVNFLFELGEIITFFLFQFVKTMPIQHLFNFEINSVY